jgi:hypothetical protein
MIRIDDTLLEEIGLITLPKAERDQLLKQIYDTLEMRVGMRLAERMSDQQLDEFERFIDTNDESGALAWLESNFPDYKQVVADELEKLKSEIKQDSSKILAAMQGQAGQLQQAAPSHQQFAPPAPAQQPYQQPVQQSQYVAPQFSQPLNSNSAQYPQPSQPYQSPAQQNNPTTSQDDFSQQPPQQDAPSPGASSIPPPPTFG